MIDDPGVPYCCHQNEAGFRPPRITRNPVQIDHLRVGVSIRDDNRSGRAQRTILNLRRAASERDPENEHMLQNVNSIEEGEGGREDNEDRQFR